MDLFEYRDGTLYCEGVKVRDIAAEVGTPVYIYSRATIEHHYRRVEEAFSATRPLICYSVKANGNLAVLRLLKGLGAGFDVVSGGELYRALKAGADPRKIVFAGVGKTDPEIRRALQAGILMFNSESLEEVENIDRIAAAVGRKAPVAIRVNPDIDPGTHTYITTGKAENKFGVDIAVAEEIAAEVSRMKHVELMGFHCHIGSQITDIEPYGFAVQRMLELFQKCRESYPLEYLNIGGGFGVYYRGGEARPVREFADQIMPFVEASRCKLILEPGRFIVGNAGVLVTEVQYVKASGAKRFVICDAGMNDLMRPALYGAFHKIWPVEADAGPERAAGDLPKADVVGPVCESADFFAKDRPLPPLERGDLVSIFTTGAYGFTMSNNYNSRPRPPEVLVEGNSRRLVRKREMYEDLIRGETAK
ncbi:MAG: diaminopimelate decarboxylase [Planctomycetota bacterium]|nr:MAG: diaminopimelate decarboxylase [Planctomycetota bacterium]